MDEALALLKECVQLCTDLQACLAEERDALVALQTDILVQCNFKKETLGLQIRDKRRQLRIAVKMLPPEEAREWQKHEQVWLAHWEAVRAECERNQRLLKHSLKNLGNIVDNLKRLFGVNRTYSSAGKRVEASAAGKVVEVRT